MGAGHSMRCTVLDGAGRTRSVVTGSGVTRYEWDVEDRLVRIVYAGGAENSFGYNAFGARVSRVDSSGMYRYWRSGVSVVSPVLSDGVADYTPGISERRGGVSTFYHADLKSGVVQTGSSGLVSGRRAYDAFGNVVGSTGTWQGPFSYGGPFGYQTDEDSGLLLLGHRYFDPTLGRFLSRDPIGDGRNWYTYCGNNPLKYADIDGLKKKLVVIRGDISGEDWFWINLYWWLVFLPWVWRLFGSQYEIIVIYSPSKSEAIEAIADADAVIFYGHGYFGMIVLRAGSKGGKKGGKKKKGDLSPEVLTTTDIATIEAERRKRKKGKLDFVFFASCYTCADKGWRDAWLRIAVEVWGYETETYDPSKPLDPPEYRKWRWGGIRPYPGV